MAVKNLSLTACEVGEALAICETAASRKIADAEHLLCEIAQAVATGTRSRRTDRVRTAVVQRLRTIARLAERHPETLEPWVAAVLAEQRRGARSDERRASTDRRA